MGGAENNFGRAFAPPPLPPPPGAATENQNTKNATCAARLEIQNGGSGKHQYKPRCSRMSTFFA